MCINRVSLPGSSRIYMPSVVRLASSCSLCLTQTAMRKSFFIACRSLKESQLVFHGPYYETEHSAAPGTPEYAALHGPVRQTLPYCVRLRSQYLVFHHNNIPVTEKRREEMIRVSRENYREIAELFKPHQIPVVVENAGVLDRGNMLFDQDAFIQLCREEHYPVLIDIGHAYANGWDLAQTMEALKDQIVAYHLHNNDGVHDSHQRIFHGTLDFPLFLSDYQRLTPNADLVLEYSPNVADDESGIQEDISWLLEQIRR